MVDRIYKVDRIDVPAFPFEIIGFSYVLKF